MTLVFGETKLCKHGNVAPCKACDPYAVARNTDPETSKEAAASIPSESIRQSQALILELLKEIGPATDQRLWQFQRIRSRMSPSGARTRRAELVEMGKVVDSGKRETLPSGRRAIVWKAA